MSGEGEHITTKEQAVGQHARWKQVVAWRMLLDDDAKGGEEIYTSQFLEKVLRPTI